MTSSTDLLPVLQRTGREHACPLCSREKPSPKGPVVTHSVPSEQESLRVQAFLVQSEFCLLKGRVFCPQGLEEGLSVGVPRKGRSLTPVKFENHTHNMETEAPGLGSCPLEAIVLSDLNSVCPAKASGSGVLGYFQLNPSLLIPVLSAVIQKTI